MPSTELADVVCSNFDARIHRVIKEMGLTGFAEVLPSSLVGIPKTDPEIILLASSLLEIEPEELLHVGDNAEEDGLPPRRRAVLFLSGHRQRRPELIWADRAS